MKREEQSLDCYFSRQSRKFLLFGHRGYSSIAPENTLSAFQKVVDNRIPGIELDVQLCLDDEVVVFHDENLQRITGVNAAVQAYTVKQLKNLEFLLILKTAKDI